CVVGEVLRPRAAVERGLDQSEDSGVIGHPRRRSPNARANLPGPLQRQHAARNRNAAPVKFSDWLAAIPGFDQPEFLAQIVPHLDTDTKGGHSCQFAKWLERGNYNFEKRKNDPVFAFITFIALGARLLALQSNKIDWRIVVLIVRDEV